MSRDPKAAHIPENCGSNEKCKVTLCLYNHTKRPPCRYGLKCERSGCWYNHFDPSRKRTAQLKTNNSSCRYGKSCKSKKCIFNHPGRTDCRSGNNCFSKFCWYNHPTLMCIHRNCKKEKDTVDPCPFRHSRRSEQPGSWRDDRDNHEEPGTSGDDSDTSSSAISDGQEDDDSEKPNPDKRIHLPVFEERMKALGCLDDEN